MKNENKLYMIMLGCRPEGRYTEQHDIFFGIGTSLKELIPNMLFLIDDDFDSEEKELIKIFSDKNMNLEYRDRKMNVFWMKHKENNPAIIFSKESLQDYNFMIKRIDGLNFYIYM